MALLVERLAFVGSLCALVLGLLWPHVKPIVVDLVRTSGWFGSFMRQDLANDHHRHPRHIGQVLRRAASEPAKLQIKQGAQYVGASHTAATSGGALTIFSAIVVALVAYSLLKLIGCACGPRQSSPECARKRRLVLRDERSNPRTRGVQSREQRVRQLVRAHGGRNLSSAIRFLAAELVQQRHTLLKDLSEDPETSQSKDLSTGVCASCGTDQPKTD